jgi:hypothetical protein
MFGGTIEEKPMYHSDVLSRILWIGLLASASALGAERESHPSASPRGYGIDSYSVTSVPAIAFAPDFPYRNWGTSGSLGRYGETNVDQHYYASVDIPAGAEIAFMTLNNVNDGTPGVVTARLLLRFDTGAVLTWGTVACTAHDYWQTDYSAPINLVFQGNDYGGAAPRVLLLDVEIAASANLQFFGTVEVWWKRTVIPAPGFATFNDVPTTDPAFQFVEALAASGVSAGCGGGNFCPDLPVTRRQMAVFLSKALGLHWPE